MRAMYRVQGITDDVTTCECCGLVNLKRTVRLIELDAEGADLDAVYYGTDCAARAAGTTRTRISNAAAAGVGLMRRAESWARDAIATFTDMTVSDYIAANMVFAGEPARAAASLAATIAEARQILAGGGLVGTRFAWELAGLPTVLAEKAARPAPRRAAVSAVSAGQGMLF